jgi:hypothetical protein
VCYGPLGYSCAQCSHAHAKNCESTRYNRGLVPASGVKQGERHLLLILLPVSSPPPPLSEPMGPPPRASSSRRPPATSASREPAAASSSRAPTRRASITVLVPTRRASKRSQDESPSEESSSAEEVRPAKRRRPELTARDLAQQIVALCRLALGPEAGMGSHPALLMVLRAAIDVIGGDMPAWLEEPWVGKGKGRSRR